MTDHAPRVLIISPESFNEKTGAGITFRNLFTDWPREALAIIHHDFLPVADSICGNSYILTSNEVRKIGWWLRRVPFCTRVVDSVLGSAHQNRVGGLVGLLKFIKRLIFGDGVPEQVHLTDNLESWIKSFSPTLIYSVLGSNSMMEMTNLIRVRFGLPLVVHIMDDWMSVLYRKGLLSPWQTAKKERLFIELIGVSVARLSICEEMSRAYMHRYGLSFQHYQNVIDVNKWREYACIPEAVGSPVRLAYIGSIFPNAQLNSLVDCCNAVQEMYEEGYPIRLEIYSPRHQAEKFRSQLVIGEAVSLLDSFADDVIFFSTLQAVDILLLPVNFDRETIEFIRYSMPTKVPAYLAVGTPVLAYGPSEVAQIAYAERIGWALTVTVQESEKLKKAIHSLSTDMELRQKISARARITAERNHNAALLRERFHSTLHAASGYL
jgi:glycosyltransferase involved in cell wall biosynthesis